MSVPKENGRYIDNANGGFFIRESGVWTRRGYLLPPRRALFVGTGFTPYLYIYDGAGAKLTDPSTIPASSVSAIATSPNGLWTVVGVGSTLMIYKNVIAGTEYVGSVPSPPAWTLIKDISFAPDSRRFLVVDTTTSPYCWVFDIQSGASLTAPAPGVSVNACDWSPSGDEILLALNASPWLARYNGTTMAALTALATMPTSAMRGCAYSPNGSHFAAGGSTQKLIVWRRSDNTKVADPATLPAGSYASFAKVIGWNKAGTKLACCTGTTPYIQTYTRAGDVLTKDTDFASLPPDIARGVAFTQDDNTMFVLFASTASNTICSYNMTNRVKNAQFASQPVGQPSAIECNLLTYANDVAPVVTDFDSGSGNFTVPAYTKLEIELWGGGATGGNTNVQTNRTGVDGNSSTVSTYSLIAGGGKRSAGTQTGNVGPGGVGGTASGGNNTNTNGNDGTSPGAGATTTNTGAGGSAPNGGAGGAALTLPNSPVSVAGNPGAAPGGGGGGGGTVGFSIGSGIQNNKSAGGGSGSYVKHVFNAGDVGAPAVGASIAYAVAAAVSATNQGNGAAGRVRFTVT